MWPAQCRNTLYHRLTFEKLNELPGSEVAELTAFTINDIAFAIPNISKMYFSRWEPPGVSEWMWSVNVKASISGEYQTLGGHSGRPSK
jgi:hypothetical protein